MITYDIISRRFENSYDDFIICRSNLTSLEEAKEKREVSGDLVVLHGTNRIVTSHEWLFNWEKDIDDCYARRVIANELKRE